MQMKEAILYEKLPAKNVRCHACARLCHIADGDRGYCWTRLNTDGNLYSLIYGKISSMNPDPIEKKPVYHYMPGTSVFSVGSLGCNLRCIHCQNWEIACADPLPRLADLQEVEPAELIRLAVETDCQGLAWTYNEPAIWPEYVLDTARLAKMAGLYTVFVTNSYTTMEAIDILAPYLDVYRADLKAFNNESYMKLARVPDMSHVLEAILHARNRHRLHIEIVTNLIPTINDDDIQISSMADWIYRNLGSDTPWHITRFFPYGDLSHIEPTPLLSLERARRMGLESGLRYVYIGNVPGHSTQNTFCRQCGLSVVERSGYHDTRICLNEESRCPRCGEHIPITT